MQGAISVWVTGRFVQKSREEASKHANNNNLWAKKQANVCTFYCYCGIEMHMKTSETAHAHTQTDTHIDLHAQKTFTVLYKAAARANVANQSLTAVSTYTFTAQLRAGGRHMSMQCTHSDTHYEHRVKRTHTPVRTTPVKMQSNYTTATGVFRL